MPAVLMVGISQILAIQIITPLKKDKILMSASIIGAITGIILNILLVLSLKCVGTAITLLCSESIVTLFYIVYVLKKHILSGIHLRLMLKNIIISFPSVLICLCASIFLTNPIISLSFSFIVAGLVYIVIDFYLPNSQLKSFFKYRPRRY